MKSNFFAFVLCIAVSISFSFDAVETDLTLPLHLKKEYLKTSNSNELKTVLITNFSDIFDNIFRVVIHFNSKENYYY